LILFFGLDLNFEMPPKIYDSPHQQKTIWNWKNNGLILKENQSYKDIYSYVMSIERCEKCGINFNNEIHSQRRCMDHSHKTGYFRQVLCHNCNSGFDRSAPKLQKNKKINHKWISPNIKKQKSGNICVYFHYQRKGFKEKLSTSLTKMIALSFINLLKESV
jgi:hypothetical protein